MKYMLPRLALSVTCLTNIVSSSYILSSFYSTDVGYSGTLDLVGSGSNTYGPDLQQLSLDVYFETVDIVRVKISDKANSRWEVPESVISRPHVATMPTDVNVKFSTTQSPFSFEIIRLSDERSLFKLDENSFTFKNQYIEFETIIDPSATTYGLGESTRMSQALQRGTTFTLWAEDVVALNMDVNLYGSYPYYLQLVNGTAHGALLLNSNGMDVTLTDSSLNFKVIGGVIDLYVFAGSTPASVVKQYTDIVGRPGLVPYWSLGFHNCKWGYTNLAEVQEVVANYSDAKIPLDTQWMDIDYMQDFRDFTWDDVNFPVNDVATFVDMLHERGQHFVPIVDPGIMVDAGYDAYESGIEQDIFIKDIEGSYFMGQVWPGQTYYPDFLHPSTYNYWQSQIKRFHDVVKIDGLWTDMNEASNFCNVDGSQQVCSYNDTQQDDSSCILSCITVDPTNPLDFPPYAINNVNGAIGGKAIAPSATHFGGITEYDAHNLYGLTEQIATSQALAIVRGKRPFTVSRSSFVSSGVHGAKWTGDNAATWNDLKSSIVSIMDFSLFGVPMIGSDICGFIDNTTEELCARWIEVGAFYPFSRNHNAIDNAPQELYRWNTVAEAARNALGIRYQLLPYLYTLFYTAHNAASMVVRSMWVNYPGDKACVGIDTQFMLGSAVLISPVLTEGASTVTAYFPMGLWYDFTTRAIGIDSSESGQSVVLDTPLESVNVHIYGGNILPLQDAELTTTATRLSNVTLLVALCQGGQATGYLFWDDGEQVELNYQLTVSYKAFFTEMGRGFINSTVDADTYTDNLPTVNMIQVLGTSKYVFSSPSAWVAVNGKHLSPDKVAYDTAKHSLTLLNLNLKLNEAMSVMVGH